MALHNVHERTIDSPAEVVGALLDRLGGDDDPLWPGNWVAMRFDRPLSVGADGGHGPVRYHVTAYEPGRRVRFTFHPETGIDGYHELTVTALDTHRCVVRHTLVGQPRGWMRLLVPLAVRWMHDAVLEDLLDNAESAATGGVVRPARWSRWVRLLWSVGEIPRARPTSPDKAALVDGALDRVDRTDAHRVVRLPAAPGDPQVWADAIFRRAAPPGLLLRLRNALAPLIGVERGDKSAFATVATGPDEVLLGTDADHLDFRASVLVRDSSVVLTTVVQVHNLKGRIYMAVVWPLHPLVVRRMMRRAARRLNAMPPRPVGADGSGAVGGAGPARSAAA